MRWIVRAAAALLGLAAGMCNPAHADELTVGTPDGVRSAILLPAGHARAPTVIVLHGALVSAEATVSWYGFGGAAKRRGFAAVFPRGLNLLWNDGRDAAWASGADDVGFLRRLAHRLVGARGTTDPAGLYLVGVSNGGMMALRMLCEAPEPFAGVGIDHRQHADGGGCQVLCQAPDAGHHVQRHGRHVGPLRWRRGRLQQPAGQRLAGGAHRSVPGAAERLRAALEAGHRRRRRAGCDPGGQARLGALRLGASRSTVSRVAGTRCTATPTSFPCSSVREPARCRRPT